jgi:predicted nucleic acid-binding protein
MQLKAAVDSSVLLALGKLGYLKLVTGLFDELFVAQSVFEEISGDELSAQVRELRNAGSLKIKTCSNLELLNLLSSSLGKGEAETIVLALELKTEAALLDDLKARKTARRLKLTVMGTLAILKDLLDLKLVSERPKDLCQKLVETGFWIDLELCLRILSEKT